MLDISVSRQLRDFELSVDLTVKTGEYCILAGNNGAGKSTLLNMIAGLIDPEKGYIRSNGTTFFDAGDRINIPPEERQIGYVFQNAAVFPHLTVAENITYGLRARGMGKSLRDSNVTGLTKRLGLNHLLDCKAAQLSGGQKQLVALGRALAIEPVLLLLDEPYRALDRTIHPIVADCLQEMVTSWDIPCILVTHQNSELDLTNCWNCRIHDGKIEKSDAR